MEVKDAGKKQLHSFEENEDESNSNLEKRKV